MLKQLTKKTMTYKFKKEFIGKTLAFGRMEIQGTKNPLDGGVSKHIIAMGGLKYLEAVADVSHIEETAFEEVKEKPKKRTRKQKVEEPTLPISETEPENGDNEEN